MRRDKSQIDSGKFGWSIFINLRKAFDTVNHEILVIKLEHYSIIDSVLNFNVWIYGNSSEPLEVIVVFLKDQSYGHYFSYCI